MLKTLVLAAGMLLVGTQIANANCSLPDVEVTKKIIDEGIHFGKLPDNSLGRTKYPFEASYDYDTFGNCVVKAKLEVVYRIRIVLSEKIRNNSCLVKDVTRHENRHKSDALYLIKELHPILGIGINNNVRKLTTLNIKTVQDEVSKTINKWGEIMVRELDKAADKFHREEDKTGYKTQIDCLRNKGK